MRKMISIAALALAMALGSFSMLKGEDAPAAKPLHGKVTAIAKDDKNDKLTDITISSHGKDKTAAPVETVVKADATTTVTKGKEKEAATLADVVVGSSISVVLGDTDKPAVSIQILPPHTKKPAASTTTK